MEDSRYYIMLNGQRQTSYECNWEPGKQKMISTVKDMLDDTKRILEEKIVGLIKVQKWTKL